MEKMFLAYGVKVTHFKRISLESLLDEGIARFLPNVDRSGKAISWLIR